MCVISEAAGFGAGEAEEPGEGEGEAAAGDGGIEGDAQEEGGEDQDQELRNHGAHGEDGPREGRIRDSTQG